MGMSNMMQLHRNKRSFAVVQDMQEPSDAVTDAWVRLEVAPGSKGPRVYD